LISLQALTEIYGRKKGDFSSKSPFFNCPLRKLGYAQGASLVGEYEGEAIVFGLQARYRF
jgi:hypothetical protein